MRVSSGRKRFVDGATANPYGVSEDQLRHGYARKVIIKGRSSTVKTVRGDRRWMDEAVASAGLVLCPFEPGIHGIDVLAAFCLARLAWISAGLTALARSGLSGAVAAGRQAVVPLARGDRAIHDADVRGEICPQITMNCVVCRLGPRCGTGRA
jgi:hypothetical protein